MGANTRLVALLDLQPDGPAHPSSRCHWFHHAVLPLPLLRVKGHLLHQLCLPLHPGAPRLLSQQLLWTKTCHDSSHGECETVRTNSEWSAPEIQVICEENL